MIVNDVISLIWISRPLPFNWISRPLPFNSSLFFSFSHVKKSIRSEYHQLKNFDLDNDHYLSLSLSIHFILYHCHTHTLIQFAGHGR